ncbi:NAD(P)-binding protein [Cytobacillus sp. S13-E01]|uniref:NAD(P)-binding protein n=1 Tax=Cytobacillus sp. S13-E01 TaxID=3031326 RepID=UPI0023D804CA|nr:NAD(P)-binding protein [Cytobacillus sp. S13-E01]MDF0728039.1 NAD(P)-binding protein [Cytobacillus sp. S13-E01]
MYPVTLKIEDKPCVVVGGGAIAFLKIGPLLQAKAAVTVVSPKIIQEIEQLYLEGEINVIRKEIEYADYKDAFLIIAATNFPEINREIYENTKDTKLINVITDSEIGNFHIPATLTRGKLQISVATGGASPMLAKKIRDNLKERYDDSYEEYVEFLHDARIKIKHSSLSKEEKRKLYKEAIDERYKRSKEERYRLFMQLLPFET